MGRLSYADKLLISALRIGVFYPKWGNSDAGGVISEKPIPHPKWGKKWGISSLGTFFDFLCSKPSEIVKNQDILTIKMQNFLEHFMTTVFNSLEKGNCITYFSLIFQDFQNILKK